MPSDDEIYRKRCPLLAVVALASAGLAGWLGYLSAAKLNLPGCGSDAGCASVVYTHWGHWFDVPVSFVGAAVYLAVAVISLIPSGIEGSLRHRFLSLTQGSIALAIGLAILWFVGLQFFEVRAICTYCMASHVLGVVVVTLLLQRLSREAMPPEATTWGDWVGPLTGGIVAFLVLPVGQLSSAPPQTHDVIAQAFNVEVDPENEDDSAALSETEDISALPRTHEAPPRPLVRYSYARGQIRFTSDDAPVLGRPDAPHVALELFDYTCDSCRQLAPQLSAALERYDGQFAVLLVPCPIERKCNPYLQPGAVEHPDACEYARCAMAVWIAAPEEFHAFHDWLILSESIPLLEQARERAIELVGRDAYQQASRNKQIDRLISRGVDLYRGMSRGVMPKLLLGERMIKGAPRSAEDLFTELEKLLPIKAMQRP